MSYDLENPHNLLELDLNFSVDEIRTQLELLNIRNLTEKQLEHLKQDLDQLIENECQNILKSTIHPNNIHHNTYQSNINSEKSNSFYLPVNRNYHRESSDNKESIIHSCNSSPDESIISDGNNNDEERGDHFVVVCDDKSTSDDGENGRQFRLHRSTELNTCSSLNNAPQLLKQSCLSDLKLTSDIKFKDTLEYNDQIDSQSICWRKYLIEDQNKASEHRNLNENNDILVSGDHSNQKLTETKPRMKWHCDDLGEINPVDLMEIKNSNLLLQKKNKNESTETKQSQIFNLSKNSFKSHINPPKNSFKSHNSNKFHSVFVENHSDSPTYSSHNCDYKSIQRLEFEKLNNKSLIMNNNGIESRHPDYSSNQSHFDSVQQNATTCSNSTPDNNNMIGSNRTVKKKIRSARFLDDPVEQVHNFGHTNSKPNKNGKNCSSTVSKSCSTSLLSNLSNQKTTSLNMRTRNRDPVSRYHSYQRSWLTHSAPGENARRILRWNIKTAMMHREIPLLQRNCTEVIQLLGPHACAQLERERQRHLKSLNLDYVPPTSRRYNDLRWSIRSALNSTNQPLTARF